MSKTVVVRVQSALKSTDDALTGCAATKNAKQILASLSSTQVVISNSLQAIPSRSRSFSPVKKSLTALSNAVGSLHTGVENRDFSLSEFRESIKLVRDKFLSQATNDLSSIILTDDPNPDDKEEDSLLPSRLVIKSADFKTALKSVKEELNDFFKNKEDDENPVLTEMNRSETAYRTREEKEDANLKARLAHVASLKTKLPLKLKGSFQLLKFPIVPIFNSSILSGKKPTGRSSLVRNFSNTKLLQSLGIQHILVQDYLILEDQFILAINMQDVSDVQKDASTKDAIDRKLSLQKFKRDEEEREKTAIRLQNSRDAAQALQVKEAKIAAEQRKQLLAFKRANPGSPIPKNLQPKQPKQEDLSKQIFRAMVETKKIGDANMMTTPSKPKNTRSVVRPVDYAKSVLEALNEKAPSKYTLVTDQVLVNPRNADILFFWVIPRKTLTALISKGWSKVVQWGFPW